MPRVVAAPRVVLDTHIVLSALVFPSGPAAQLRRGWQDASCLPLVDTLTVQELIRVLAYPKFRLSPEAQQELLADYLPYAEIVKPAAHAPSVPAGRDPFDLPFLQLAAAGRARVLVTGDKDLLALNGQTPFAIQPLSVFLASLAE